MSTALYVVPLVQTTFAWRVDALGNPLTVNVPEYSVNEGDPLFGAAFVCMPLDGASLVLVATAPNAALAAESGVFSFPADLGETMTDADVTALTTVLSNAGVPTDFLITGIEYGEAAHTIAGLAQVFQQSVASGNPVQLGSSPQGKSGGSIAGGGGSSSSGLLTQAQAVTGPLYLSAGDSFQL